MWMWIILDVVQWNTYNYHCKGISKIFDKQMMLYFSENTDMWWQQSPKL